MVDQLVEEKKKELSCSWLGLSTKCFPISSPFSSNKSPEHDDNSDEEIYISAADDFAKETQRKPGGWKSMPFILGMHI